MNRYKKVQKKVIILFKWKNFAKFYLSLQALSLFSVFMNNMHWSYN